MSDLFQLIVEEKNLKILEKALSLLDQAYSITEIENADSVTTKKLLDILRTTKYLFDNTEIISGFSASKGSSCPELFHKGCATQLNDLNSENFVFVPGFGTLKHMVHRGDFSLQYLECTKCKKVFRISPEQTKTIN